MRGARNGRRIVLIDCGVKRAILAQLEALGRAHRVVPYNATEEEVLADDPDAVFISPGPGDPTDLAETIELLRRLVGAQAALWRVPWVISSSRWPAAAARTSCRTAIAAGISR